MRFVLDSVNKTLYIPLYGKALVSKKGIILKDTHAEEIWEKVAFPLGRRSRSKYLAYYMAMRARVFDDFVREKTAEHPDTAVLHLGAGLDGRALRVGAEVLWYDVDFPEVIAERAGYFTETERYRMIASDIREDFLSNIPRGKHATVAIEGVSMYLKNEELCHTLRAITEHFESVALLVDCYTPFAAKMSKIKNPVKEVGVSEVFGVASPEIFEEKTGLSFVSEREITPKTLINELSGMERAIFGTLYGGKMSKKLYKLYEYKF